MTAPKISVYSLPDLKNTTDDALPNYLNSLKFRQSHTLTDVRLALGYTAVVIAAVTFYFDYRLGWDKTKGWTLWAVVVYFILNSALTFWIWGMEKGKVFVGEKDGAQVREQAQGVSREAPLLYLADIPREQLSLSSSVTKHKPIYNLTVRYLAPSARSSDTNSATWHTIELSAPFTKWFSADGYFVAKPFQQWLASEIPIVGAADPGNVVQGRGEVKTVGAEDMKGVLDGLKTGSSVRETGSPATATRTRKSKRSGS